MCATNGKVEGMRADRNVNTTQPLAVNSKFMHVQGKKRETSYEIFAQSHASRNCILYEALASHTLQYDLSAFEGASIWIVLVTGSLHLNACVVCYLCYCGKAPLTQRRNGSSATSNRVRATAVCS
jgi:hypothetical protein